MCECVTVQRNKWAKVTGSRLTSWTVWKQSEPCCSQTRTRCKSIFHTGTTVKLKYPFKELCFHLFFPQCCWRWWWPCSADLQCNLHSCCAATVESFLECSGHGVYGERHHVLCLPHSVQLRAPPGLPAPTTERPICSWDHPLLLGLYPGVGRNPTSRTTCLWSMI